MWGTDFLEIFTIENSGSIHRIKDPENVIRLLYCCGNKHPKYIFCFENADKVRDYELELHQFIADIQLYTRVPSEFN